MMAYKESFGKPPSRLNEMMSIELSADCRKKGDHGSGREHFGESLNCEIVSRETLPEVKVRICLEQIHTEINDIRPPPVANGIALKGVCTVRARKAVVQSGSVT